MPSLLVMANPSVLELGEGLRVEERAPGWRTVSTEDIPSPRTSKMAESLMSIDMNTNHRYGRKRR